MGTEIYQQNLAALQSSRPQLAALVQSIQPDPKRYRLFETKSGLSSLEYIDTNGKEILWHSRYEPLREVQRDLSSIDHSRIYMPLFGGIGLGYGLRTLWNNYRDDFFDVAVLEPDPVIFRLTLETTRMDDILSDSRFHLHVGGDLNSWNELVRTLIPSIMSCALQYIPHNPTLACHGEFMNSALMALQQRIQLTHAEFDLLTKSGPQIQENMWNNFHRIINSIRLDDVRGSLQGKPAIVIAAGPSLDKNVQQLRGMEERFALIAVDTAYRTMKNHGIDPHILVSTDPTELNVKHFEGIRPASDTILAFDPEVYSEIPGMWPYRTLYLNLEKTAYTRWIESVFGPFGFLPKGGSVGHTAFYLARALGADPIIFTGLDLAFDPGGGKTHTQGSALHRSHETIKDGSNSALLSPRTGAGPLQETIVWVPGIYGNLVPTSQIMSLYINQFAEEFACTRARLIDASEGGAKISGTEIMPLQQATSSFGPLDDMQSVFAGLASHDMNDLAKTKGLDPILSALDSAESLAKQGRDNAVSLHGRLSEGSALRGSAEWREMESLFSSVYNSNEIKIALEQSLFSAVYSFIQKERPGQITLRLKKYENYFHSVLAVLPHFRERILRVKSM